MSNELFDFGFVLSQPSSIKIIGIGNGGCKAVEKISLNNNQDVDCLVCNTDASSLERTNVTDKLQLGLTLTGGKGTGSSPECGEESARESIDDIQHKLEDGTQMVLLVACLGGGTGTGATPVIAQIARDMGLLTIAIVTTPALDEGIKRHKQAAIGLRQIHAEVDSVLQIDHDQLIKHIGDMPLSSIIHNSDILLNSVIRGLCNTIILKGNVNVDFADVETVLSESGSFIIALGKGRGARKGMDALEMALESPLLGEDGIVGVDNILLNIIFGKNELTLSEVGEIIDTLQRIAGVDTDIIWGDSENDDLNDEIEIVLIVTGKVIKTYIEKKYLLGDLDQKDMIETPKETENEIKSSKSEMLIDDWFYNQFNQLFEENDSQK